MNPRPLAGLPPASLPASQAPWLRTHVPPWPSPHLPADRQPLTPVTGAVSSEEPAVLVFVDTTSPSPVLIVPDSSGDRLPGVADGPSAFSFFVSFRFLADRRGGGSRATTSSQEPRQCPVCHTTDFWRIFSEGKHGEKSSHLQRGHLQSLTCRSGQVAPPWDPARSYKVGTQEPDRPDPARPATHLVPAPPRT